MVKFLQKSALLINQAVRSLTLIVRSDFYVNGMVGSLFNNFFFKLNFFFLFYIKMGVSHFLNNSMLKSLSRLGSSYTILFRVTLATVLFVIIFFFTFLFYFIFILAGCLGIPKFRLYLYYLEYLKTQLRHIIN